MSDAALDALAQRVADVLRTHGRVLATAESCTGGWVSMLVTSVAGSSAWFDRGFVTYTNAAKTAQLGVPQATLDAHGAVSEAVVVAMATGALAGSQADVAVAVSGVAGPGGGTATKPVGMVCIGWALRDGTVEASTFRFDGDRTAVRRASVIAALEGVIERVSRPVVG
ncbi:MAG: CinA family protein [Burkholderiales bacterium]|nr:CinA family protein [Burkholderiales bacterium]